MVQLSGGAIETLINGGNAPDPTLQLLNIRRIDGANGPARYRLKMSDGVHSLSSFMLCTQLNPMAEDNTLVQNCVCLLKKSVTNTLKDGRRVVIIMDIEVVQSAEEVGGPIGDPTPYSEGQSKGPQSAPNPPAVRPLQPQNLNDGSVQNDEDILPKRRRISNGLADNEASLPKKDVTSSARNKEKMAATHGHGSRSSHSSDAISVLRQELQELKNYIFTELPKLKRMLQRSQTGHASAAVVPNSPSSVQSDYVRHLTSQAKKVEQRRSRLKLKVKDIMANRGLNRDFGKKAPYAMPSTPGGTSKVVPIASLNPYQSKWTIRARVTNKNSIRTWSNSRGDGKLFSMEIVDESGEIRVTGFNQEVDKFYSLIETGKVYHISKGTLKIANKQYSSLKNDYEMTLNGESTIIPCEDSGDVPVVKCDFISIGDLEARDKDAIVDVIGVCKTVDEVTRLTTKTSREVSKRTVGLMDMSGKVVTVTLWGEEAEKFDGSGQPILAIKGAKVSDFGGRSLSASFSSTLMINPDIPEAYKLRGWYDKEGHAMDGQSLTEVRGGSGGGNTNWKTLTDVKTEHLGHGEKADYFSCIATIVYLRKENCLYQACPSQDCNKKVVDQQNGMYRCEKCDKEFPNFKYRLILSANVADYADNQWVTCFQESAEAILGQNAAYLGQLKDSNEAAFDEVFQQANFNTFVFRNRVKLETYNDESRIKATVMDVKPVDHKEYSKRLIMNIRSLAA